MSLHGWGDERHAVNVCSLLPTEPRMAVFTRPATAVETTKTFGEDEKAAVLFFFFWRTASANRGNVFVALFRSLILAAAIHHNSGIYT